MIARLKAADWLLGLSALALLALLSFDWFSATLPVGGGVRRTLQLEIHTTGWAALGWAAVALTVLVAALAIAVVWMLAAGALDSRTIAPHVVLAVLAPIAFLVLLIVVLTKPGLGAGLPPEAVGIEPAAWFGLGAAAVLWLASWRSLGHTRQDVPGRIVTPPPPLPAPPASAPQQQSN